MWVVIRHQVASCSQSSEGCVRKYSPRRVIHIILYFDSEILGWDSLPAALPGLLGIASKAERSSNTLTEIPIHSFYFFLPVSS